MTKRKSRVSKTQRRVRSKRLNRSRVGRKVRRGKRSITHLGGKRSRGKRSRGKRSRTGGAHESNPNAVSFGEIGSCVTNPRKLSLTRPGQKSNPIESFRPLIVTDKNNNDIRVGFWTASGVLSDEGWGGIGSFKSREVEAEHYMPSWLDGEVNPRFAKCQISI